MPRRPQCQDDGVATSDSDEEPAPQNEASECDEDESEDSDAEEITSALNLPPPDAAIPELRKVSVRLLSAGLCY